MPLVSVVTSLYNHRPFLPERVRSILGQTLSDIEWIIVDDCSTDGSFDEIRTLTRSDARVRLLRNSSNQGHIRTNQRGLDEASGEFVYRVDSDDSCDPTFLRKMTDVMNAHPAAGLAYCRSLRMDAKGGIWGGIPKKPGFLLTAPDGFARLALNYDIRSPSLLFRREVLERVGGFLCLPAGMTTEWHADWHLALRVTMVSDMVFHPEALAYHRMHHSNLSRDRVLAINNLRLIDDIFSKLPPECRQHAGLRREALRRVAAGVYRGVTEHPGAAAAELQETLGVIRSYVPDFTPPQRAGMREFLDRLLHGGVKLATYRQLR
jgi:glycosyltransferase involved in cell wall biosynthesis